MQTALCTQEWSEFLVQLFHVQYYSDARNAHLQHIINIEVLSFMHSEVHLVGQSIARWSSLSGT